jgi:hypothetical protein
MDASRGKKLQMTTVLGGAQIYPAFRWRDYAPGHDGIRCLRPHNAIDLEGHVVGQARKLRSTPCRHHSSSRTHRHSRDDLWSPY